MGHFGLFLEEGGGGSDKAFLPRASRMYFLGFVDLLAAFVQSALAGKVPKLVIEGHGFTPMGHGALGFACGRFAESLLGFPVLKRVQQCDALFDGRLDGA